MALGCCNEHNCRRTTPVHLAIGELSGLIYVITDYTVIKDHGNGRATLRSDHRHEITDHFKAFCRDNWTEIEAMVWD